MMINLHECYGETLQEYYSRPSNFFILISPFIGIDALERVLGDAANVTILTSWRMEHLVSGASTIDLYPLCKKRGWKLFINSRVHSKIYSDSLKSCYIGSANCTDRALFNPEGNFESLVYVPELTMEGRVQINELLCLSKLVNDEIYQVYRDLLSAIDKSNKTIPDEPDSSKFMSRYLTELPATDSPESLFTYVSQGSIEGLCQSALDHDVAFFGSLNCNLTKDQYMKKVKTRFFENAFVKMALSNVTSEGISFGSMAAFIHDNCQDVPAPYRKDVKTTVHNLFCWTVTLNPDKYYIAIPGRHSECLFKNAN